MSCKYCTNNYRPYSGYNHSIGYSGNGEYVINENMLINITDKGFYGKELGYVYINYCPMCGGKLYESE